MLISLPRNNEVTHLSKGDLADQLIPNETYDTALPQGWVNWCLTRGFDPRPHVVWLYKDSHAVCGAPLALTVEACDALEALRRAKTC